MLLVYRMNKAKMIKKYFRGFLPIVIDIETSGSDASSHGILEIAAIAPDFSDIWSPGPTYHAHVELYQGALLSAPSMEVHGIIPDHPFRQAVSEKQMLKDLSIFIKDQCNVFEAKRGIMVAHNPSFDASFLHAAEKRCGIDLPLHKYTMFDTATLGMLIYRETVLARLCQRAGIDFDVSQAHGALYDTKVTAALFWQIMNHQHKLI